MTLLRVSAIGLFLGGLALSSIGISKVQAQEFFVEYSGDLLKNTSGGNKRASEYVDILYLSVDDQYQLSKNLNIVAHASALYSNGAGFSANIVGDDQVVSNLETGDSLTKLAEAWLRLEGNKWSLLAGLYDINRDFDVLDSAELFFNSSHGIGPDIGLSGGNGPSIFPFYGLGVSGFYQVNEQHSLRFSVTDGLPGDPERPSSIAAKLESGDGAFSIVEWAYKNEDQTWLVGYWQYTVSEPLSALLSSRAITDLNKGYYLRHQRSIGNSRVFFRLGTADSSFNKYDRFMGAGISFESPFSERSEDSWGFAFAYARIGQEAKINAELEGEVLEKGELNVEFTYAYSVNEYIALQPNIQLIKNAGARNIPSSTVLGIRLTLSM
ncbi:carbohydrate porin [Glaciecola petra]|uniref:Carbohydrate porin n=1 Tax=Glaciecola petra TaxID=3075602 RepID=A0ABU2ZUJ9_9ALTE|nr:carbohydrate porin [Aestuariibacter sp. P117]MDT0595718.1 carbohydrate porin [Aestuariibacter sp. P117]